MSLFFGAADSAGAKMSESASPGPMYGAPQTPVPVVVSEECGVSSSGPPASNYVPAEPPPPRLDPGVFLCHVFWICKYFFRIRIRELLAWCVWSCVYCTSGVADAHHFCHFWCGSDYHQCCGSGMFIPDPGSWFLLIPDPGSRIPDPKTATKEGWKKN